MANNSYFWSFSTKDDVADNADLLAFVLCRIIEKGMKPQIFDCIISCGANIWTRKIISDEARSLAIKAGMEEEEMLSMLYQAFTGKQADYAFRLSQLTIDQKILTWKKRLENGVEYNLGTFALDSVSAECKGKLLEEIFTYCMHDMSSAREALEQADKDNLRLLEDSRRTLELLKEAVDAKQQCEQKLIGKFVQILNAKKRKIAELKRALEDKGDGNGKISEEMDTDEENELKCQPGTSSDSTRESVCGPVRDKSETSFDGKNRRPGLTKQTAEPAEGADRLFVPKRRTASNKRGVKAVATCKYKS